MLKKRVVVARIIALSLAFVGIADVTTAAAIQDADYTAYVSSTGGFSPPYLLNVGVFGGSPATAPINASGTGWRVGESATPDPTATISIVGCTCGGEANETYYYEVVGPNGPAAVPVDIFASGDLSAPVSEPFDGAAAGLLTATPEQFETSTVYGPEADCGSDYVGGTQLYGSFYSCGQYVITDSVELVPNTLYEIGLSASAGGGEDAASAFASIDPSIYVDPSFAEADLYSIVLSPGVGNPPPPSVPEPASLALFGAALIGFGAARRRRRA